MSNPVGWFEIYVQDMPRAKVFYEQVFGVRLTELPNPDGETFAGMSMWAFDMNNSGYGASGALVKMDGVPSGGNSVLVYFSCQDCAVEAAKAAQFGGHVQRGKSSIGPHGFIALVTDTEGNLVGLHSMA